MSSLAPLLALLGVGISLFACWRAAARVSLTGGPGCPGPYWVPLYYAVPVTALPILLVHYVFGFNGITTIRGVPNDVFALGSVWLVYGVVAMCASLIFFDRLFGRVRMPSGRDSPHAVIGLVVVASVVLLSILYFKLGTLPVLHMGSSIVGVLRKQATTAADFSPYYKSTLACIAYFGMAYAATIRGQPSVMRILKIIFIVVCLVDLVWDGEKAPVLKGLLTYYFAWLLWNGRAINVKRALLIVLLGVSGVLVLYRLTHAGESFEVMLGKATFRLFVGQMVGYYQGLAFTTPDPQYLLTWLPFHGIWGQPIVPYARQLMVALYGNNDVNGFLNSIFLQEAWGALGYFGLVVSPIVVGAAIPGYIRLFVWALRRFAGRRFLIAGVFALLNVTSVVGAFGPYVFLSGLLFPLAVLSVLAVAARLVSPPKAAVFMRQVE